MDRRQPWSRVRLQCQVLGFGAQLELGFVMCGLVGCLSSDCLEGAPTMAKMPSCLRLPGNPTKPLAEAPNLPRECSEFVDDYDSTLEDAQRVAPKPLDLDMLQEPLADTVPDRLAATVPSPAVAKQALALASNARDLQMEGSPGQNPGPSASEAPAMKKPVVAKQKRSKSPTYWRRMGMFTILVALSNILDPLQAEEIFRAQGLRSPQML